jgi:hypothetical protein
LSTESLSNFPTAKQSRRADPASKQQPYDQEGDGGESVSQSSFKDQAFSTFLDQNPPLELRPKWNSAFDKKPVPLNGPPSIRGGLKIGRRTMKPKSREMTLRTPFLALCICHFGLVDRVR